MIRLLGLAFVSAKLVHVARRNDWSHVHVHSCGDAANVALFASSLGPLTYSLTLHNPLAVYGANQAMKWRHARFGVAVNRQIRDEMTRDLAGLLPAEIDVAPMGVDAERFRRTTPYLPYDGTGKVRLFCCARLNAVKGHAHLLNALCMLQRRGFDVHLRLAGQDEAGGSGYRAVLARLLADLGLEGNVQLLGAISEEAVRGELERCHIAVLASLGEGVPVALMEAMSMEVPVVATMVGGVPELVVSQSNGLLVPPERPDELADAIAEIAGDPNLATRLGRAGRATVLDGFTSDKSARLIAERVAALAN